MMSTDISFDRAEFSLSQNNQAQSAVFVNNTYQSLVRISFATDIAHLQNLPSQLSDLFSLQELQAEFLCENRVYSFDNIKIDENSIGVIVKEVASSMQYFIEGVEYNPLSQSYSFTISVSSEESTQLRRAFISMSYSSSTFFSNQVANEFLTVLNTPGTIATDFPIYGFNLEDVGNDAFSLVMGNTDIVPGSVDEYALIGEESVPLIRLEMKVSDCSTTPALAFIKEEMQGKSFYYDEENFPLFALSYDPVLVGAAQKVPPCGCDDNPKINKWNPETIIAGDNQILTITGENFGVFQRGADPGEDGTGSSVLFKNGDYIDILTGPNAPPEYIAAAREDFRIGGILKWTDTEIQVKVPSTDWTEGAAGTASTGKFIVRNACNKEDRIGLFENLKIPYAKSNFRPSNESVAKRLGLRNDNGLSGNQDGYEFEFHPNVNNFNLNIKDAFDDALSAWCAETNIRFKKRIDEAPAGASLGIDGRNLISVVNLSDASIEAGLIMSQAYFAIDCKGSDLSTTDGGFIMRELDFVVNDDFAMTNDESRAERVFTHELGHAHMLGHARCIGALCNGPLMEPQSGTGIKDVDIEGGNEVFDDSETVISNGCELGGVTVSLVRIQTGGCGISVATEELVPNLINIFPNPTTNMIFLTEVIPNSNYVLSDLSGQVIRKGRIYESSFTLNLSHQSVGTYFLKISNEQNNHYFKIIKL